MRSPRSPGEDRGSDSGGREAEGVSEESERPATEALLPWPWHTWETG